MSDQTIEQEIQAKGKTAARVTPADIEANIASEHFFTAEHGVAGAMAVLELHQRTFQSGHEGTLGLLTFCVLVLRNGFVVTGESACASPENFDAQGFQKQRLSDMLSTSSSVTIFPSTFFTQIRKKHSCKKSMPWHQRMC